MGHLSMPWCKNGWLIRCTECLPRKCRLIIVASIHIKGGAEAGQAAGTPEG